MVPMVHPASTLWLQPAAPRAGGQTDAMGAATGCGACLSSASGPQCRDHVTGEACAHPRLSGRDDLLGRVLRELNAHVVDPGTRRGVVDLQWVRALRIDDGEAELTLSFAPQCGPGKGMAEAAFETLRRLLPDTDVYVRNVA